MTPWHKARGSKAKKGAKPNASRTVVGYTRVSSQEQADSGVSLDAQREKLAAYCVAHDLTLGAVYSDPGISGGTLERPGLQEALAALRRGEARGIVVPKLDRLTRSVRDLGALLDDYFCEGRFDLLSVHDHIDTRTAAGRLMLNILTSVAGWEREAGGERTAAALERLRASNRVFGGIPTSMKDSGKRDPDGRRILVRDPVGAATVERAKALRDEGYSFRQIASMLESEGHGTARGGKWEGATVASILATDAKQRLAAATRGR